MQQVRLTGSRIRERRLFLRMKQAELAKEAGISAAYLNLIEHNRRRIGGKLLNNLARLLGVDPTALSEGAEDALLGEMREAAGRQPEAEAELLLAEDFAGRFSGWAALVAAQHRRVNELEGLVEALSDRLTHDPQLAASLHEVISTVTAIRSTASILSEGQDIDPKWQHRFLRNMREESRRLSTSAQGLVDYLDAGQMLDGAPLSPQEELSVFLAGHGYHFASLEGEGDAEAIETLISAHDTFQSDEGRALARVHLERYVADARAMPLDLLQNEWETQTGDLAGLLTAFDQPLDRIMRRIAEMPAQEGRLVPGLVVCDGAGAITFRRPVDGFSVPRFGAGCSLWPLYQALSRPAEPIMGVVEMTGRSAPRFQCFAVALPRGPVRFDVPPVLEVTMLIIPEDPAAPFEGRVEPVGASCRVCSRLECRARREPSVMAKGDGA